MNGKDFVKKWKGIAKGVDPVNAKFDYLIEKHNNEKNEYTIDDFVKEWKGVSEGVDPDKAKYEYLMEKHKT